MRECVYFHLNREVMSKKPKKVLALKFVALEKSATTWCVKILPRMD